MAVEPGPPRWVHGDFHSGNLLARAGRISTVLDFGSFGYGDPAADLDIAYAYAKTQPYIAAQSTREINQALLG